MRNITKLIRFSEDEWREVERRAAKVNKPPAVFIRDIALMGEIRLYDMQEYDDLKIPLHNISGNINQIAKVANSTGNVYEKDIEDLRTDVAELRRLFDDYFSELRYEKYI